MVKTYLFRQIVIDGEILFECSHHRIRARTSHRQRNVTTIIILKLKLEHLRISVQTTSALNVKGIANNNDREGLLCNKKTIQS